MTERVGSSPLEELSPAPEGNADEDEEDEEDKDEELFCSRTRRISVGVRQNQIRSPERDTPAGWIRRNSGSRSLRPSRTLMDCA